MRSLTRTSAGRGIMPIAAALASCLVVAVGLSQDPAAAPTLADDPQWLTRLESLRPEQPMEYFELAEELADRAVAASDLQLARELFGLAGVLDPTRLAASACLALADLETREHVKRRLHALAMLLSERRETGWEASRELVGEPVSEGAAVAVADALSYYRRGLGSRALALLRRPDAMTVLRSLDRLLPGGVDRFVEDCRVYRTGQSEPRLTEDERRLMIRAQAALLAESRRSWSGELLLNGGQPLIEVDPQRLPEILNANPERPYYRRGRWAGSPGRPAATPTRR